MNPLRWHRHLKSAMEHSQQLKKHLLNLLDAEGARITFDEAVKNFPPKLRGLKPEGAPHTAWQLLEHMRIAQWDILEFSRNAGHVSPEWPAGYWPKSGRRICTPGFLKAPARQFSGRRCWSRTTMRTISDSWSCCGDCLGPGP